MQFYVQNDSSRNAFRLEGIVWRQSQLIDEFLYGYGRSTGGPCGLQLGLSRFGGNNLPLLTLQSEHYLSMICEDADDEINPPPPPVALW